MRVAGWDIALAEWACARLDAPFAWGACDCSILCFEAFDLLTGGDLAAAWRGRYADEQAALEITRSGVDVRSVLARAGCGEIRPNFQQRGDFLIAFDGHFWAGAVCLGARCLSADRARGAVMTDTQRLLVADGCVILGVR